MTRKAWLLLFVLLIIGAFAVSQGAKTSRAAQPVSLVVWTGEATHSLRDYVDRRMFWTGVVRKYSVGTLN